ncbi:MAG TPA: N-acetyltransferase [Gemmatales bacterium]|nr:N-acetyltransferase [Gemmatales bacterium]
MPTFRPELPMDVPAIAEVLATSFPTAEEAEVVKALRHNGHLSISLVAEEQGMIVGYIAFSPVTVDGKAGGLGLAPVAVVPDFQSLGIGSMLVEEGLSFAKATGAGYVVVLGHSHYYPRFGFQAAKPLGYTNEYDADESFMILELKPDGLPPKGLIKYGPEFGAWT